MQASLSIFDGGMMPGAITPLGGYAGTIAWLFEQILFLFLPVIPPVF